MSQALRKLTGTLSKSKTCLIFINQIRMKIGVMFGNPETTTGGLALKFYSTIRLEVRKVESISHGQDDVVGNKIRVKVVKNKIAPPFRKAEMDLMFGKGISASGSLLDAAVQNGVVEKAGSWFSYGKERIGQGAENARDVPRGESAGHGRDRGEGPGRSSSRSRLPAAGAIRPPRRPRPRHRHPRRGRPARNPPPAPAAKADEEGDGKDEF